MEKWDFFESVKQGLKAVGVEVSFIFAGIAGAIVSLPKHKTLTLIEKIILIFSGGAVANYLTPLFSNWIGAGQNTRDGMAFLVGYLGFKSIELAIDFVKSKFEKK